MSDRHVPLPHEREPHKYPDAPIPLQPRPQGPNPLTTPEGPAELPKLPKVPPNRHGG